MKRTSRYMISACVYVAGSTLQLASAHANDQCSEGEDEASKGIGHSFIIQVVTTLVIVSNT